MIKYNILFWARGNQKTNRFLKIVWKKLNDVKNQCILHTNLCQLTVVSYMEDAL